MKRVVASAAVAVALMMAGCSGARHPGDVLRVAVGPIASFDPAQARSADERWVAGALYETLTAYQPGTLEPGSGLAIRWRYTTDERQWTFTLRPGARFSNGRPVTSTDVKYSLERVARKGSSSPGAGLLQPVTGWQPFAVDGTAPELVGVTTPSPQDVRIVLDQPWSLFPSVLANPVLSIVPREAVDVTPPTPGLGDRPVGSGPYRWDGRKGSDVLLRSTGPKGPARLELDRYDTASAASDALGSGHVDLAPIAPERLGSLVHTGTVLAPSLREQFFGLNLKAPVLADLSTRQAVIEAVDPRTLVDAVFGAGARPLAGIVGDGVPGHQDDACGSVCPDNPTAAAAQVARLVGSGHHPALFVDFPASGTNPTLAGLLAGQLQAAGFAVQLRSHPPADYDAFVASGQAQIFAMEWTASYPSPDAFLTPLFASGSASNRTNLASPGVDAALRAARLAADPAERDAALQDAERQVLGQAPVIPIAQFLLHEAVAPRVRGLTILPTGTFDVTRISLRP